MVGHQGLEDFAFALLRPWPSHSSLSSCELFMPYGHKPECLACRLLRLGLPHSSSLLLIAGCMLRLSFRLWGGLSPERPLRMNPPSRRVAATENYGLRGKMAESMLPRQRRGSGRRQTGCAGRAAFPRACCSASCSTARRSGNESSRMPKTIYSHHGHKPREIPSNSQFPALNPPYMGTGLALGDMEPVIGAFRKAERRD